VLRRHPHNGLERTLALALSAAVLFIVANSFPFLSFEMKGHVTQTTLVSGAIDLYQQGKAELSVLVLLMLVLTGAVASFEPEAVWERLEKRR